MDIKNILNDGERRASQSPTVSAPPSPIDVKPQHSAIHLSSTTPHYTHPQAPPSHIPPPPLLPPQQIVYTGPVYQLQPAVEVRHMGNEIHYRYTPPFSTFQQPPHLDYTVYQEYPEIPLHHPAYFPHDSRYDRLHPPSRSALTHAGRYIDPHDHPLHQIPTDELQRPRPRPHARIRDDPSDHQHSAHPSCPPSTLNAAYEYGQGSTDDSPSQRYSQRRFRAEVYARDYSPQRRVFSRAAVSSSHGAASSHEAHTMPGECFDPEQQRNKSSYRYRHPGPFRNYDGYVSYYGPDYPTVHAYESHSPRQRNTGAYSTDQDESRQAFGDNDCQLRGRPYAHSDQHYRAVNRIMQTSSELHFEQEFSEDDDAPIISKGRRPKKRERANRTMHSRHPPARGRLRNNDGDEVVVDLGEESGHYSPYDPDFLRAGSIEPDSSKERDSSTEHDSSREHEQSCHNLSTLRVIKKAKQARARAKATAMAVDQRRKNQHEMWSSASVPWKKKRAKQERNVPSRDDSPIIHVKTEERVSPAVTDEGPVAVVESSHKTDSPDAETSSCEDEERIIIDDSLTVSDRDGGTPSRDNDVAQSLTDTESWTEHHDQDSLRIEDPDEPYPQTFQEFAGIPPAAIGDMLQLWEFISSFSKTLRLSSFKLRHLEEAVVYGERSTLLDACLVRLVQGILADSGLVDELDVSDELVKKITSKGTKNIVGLILVALPGILAYESDEADDTLLHSTIERLVSSSDKWAFYRILKPEGKLRIFRELVDYATMTDVLRGCVADTMEHAEEERKKAREQNAANRKKLEQQIREHKEELQKYRVKHGLLESPIDSQKEKGVNNGKSNSGGNGGETLSRKQKLLAAKKERMDEEERRSAERGAEAIVAKIERDRASLKTLKNLRLRNRASICAREGELFDDSIAAPSMPFTSRHDDPVRSHPIGTDRDGRCYWFFEGSGRVWIEDTRSSEWCTLNDRESLEGLLRWLSPHRKEENQLKKSVKSRLDFIVAEMAREAKEVRMAKAEVHEDQEDSSEILPRYTRARKRKAEMKKMAKLKKGKSIESFLDYRNVEK